MWSLDRDEKCGRGSARGTRELVCAQAATRGGEVLPITVTSTGEIYRHSSRRFHTRSAGHGVVMKLIRPLRGIGAYLD